MLKPEFKQKLLDALRSDQYRSCCKVLRSGDCYCPLGVLCDISQEGEWVWMEDAPSYKYRDSSGNMSDKLPPIGVVNLVLDVKVDDASEEGIKVLDLKDAEGFVKAIKRINPKRMIRHIRSTRVFDALATAYDHGATLHQIIEVIEQYF